VLDAFAGQYGYKEFDDNQNPNPQTKGQFAKQVLLQHIKNSVIAWEASQASDDARLLAIDSAENDIQLG
jgi:hypothetical protein